MNFNSVLIDRKIRGINIGIDLPIREYMDVAMSILESNPFQRKQVSSRGKPYALLRRDLISGCVMPPIILAVTETICSRFKNEIDRILNSPKPDHLAGEHLKEIIKAAFEAKELMILDGLQRTYTLQACFHDLENGAPTDFRYFVENLLRVEIYVGLSRVGILYRMLTLNTTQTPMSFRQQIEIMYHDYLDAENLPDGIKVLKEVEERRARGSSKYKYSDVVDMYYAYTTGKPQSLDKQALVHQLAELDFIEGYKSDTEDLLSLLVCYNKFVRHIEHLSEHWSFPSIQSHDPGPARPFGLNTASIFQKVQPMTAFGAEVKRLMSTQKNMTFKELNDLIERCSFTNAAPHESLDELIIILDQVALKASKIGPAQREFFQYCFRLLLNPESDCFLDVSRCWLEGQEKYIALNSDDF